MGLFAPLWQSLFSAFVIYNNLPWYFCPENHLRMGHTDSKMAAFFLPLERH